MYAFHAFLLVILIPASTSKGTHSFALNLIYIKGDTPFPEFIFTTMLDDITVGYFDSEKRTYVARNSDNVEEDYVVDPAVLKTITSNLHAHFEERWLYVKHYSNNTDSIHVQQRLVTCELTDDDTPGPMITKNAMQGSTVDEMHYHESKYTYSSILNVTETILKTHLDIALWRYNNLYYPECMKSLRAYLEKRREQVMRKVKPRVRLIHKRVSGRSEVTCLATGFYPRHLNLTLLRDGRPVADHLITGGELLPNADTTYQMRKSLELSEEERKQKHKYTCTAQHLSLDNKLDVHLDFEHGDPIIVPALITLGGVLIFVIILPVCIMWKRRSKASSTLEYVSANNHEAEETSQDSSSQENVE